MCKEMCSEELLNKALFVLVMIAFLALLALIILTGVFIFGNGL